MPPQPIIMTTMKSKQSSGSIQKMPKGGIQLKSMICSLYGSRRALVKAVALHGLGLYIYAGGDLPEADKPTDELPPPPKAPVAPINGSRITPAQLRYIERLIDETGSDLAKVLAYFGVWAWQVEHQLMVTEAQVADVYVFDGSDGLLLEINTQPDAWPRIHKAWDRFVDLVARRSPPPLSKGDIRQRDDAEWTEAAQTYIEARRAADQVQRALDEAKGRLVALTSHSSEAGCGVTVTQYWRRGSIDYSKIEELRAKNLEAYRGAPRMETRVSFT